MRPALALLLSVTLLSCSLFEPRDPEEPIGSGSQFQPPTSPSIVLKNLQSALTYTNAFDYRKSFSDGTQGLPPFRFTPAADGRAVAPGRFSDWGLEDEEEYLQTIFSELIPGSIPTLILSPSDVTEAPIGDSIRFEAEYSVNFPHTRTGAEQEAFGRLRFTMKLSNRNEWYITDWEDIPVDSRPTWSVIKARFSQ